MPAPDPTPFSRAAAIRAPSSVATVALAALLIAAGPARAAEEMEGQRPEARADRSAAVGAFAPWTMTARSDTQSAVLQVRGGYDGALGGAVFESVAEGRLSQRLSILAGSNYTGSDRSFHPLLGLKLDMLRQEQHGIDLALAGAYQGVGLHLVPTSTLTAALGRTVGDFRLCANLTYGQGTQEDERYGDMRLGLFRRVARNVHAGFDSRVRVDLERAAGERAGEPAWDLVAAPEVGYTFRNFMLSAGAGLSALKLRTGAPTKLGLLVHTGIGAAF